MEYRKLTLTSADAGDRLSRILYVKNDISLKELGCLFLTTLHTDPFHPFMFETGNKNYVSSAFVNPPRPDCPCMDGYTFADLPDEFTFLFDVDYGWYFTCRKGDETARYRGKKPAGVLAGGSGAGIFLDERDSLIRYISGQIDPEAEEDREHECYLPDNLDLDTFGEFDQPLDIEYEQGYIRKYAGKMYRQYCEDEQGVFRDFEEWCHSPAWNAFAKAVNDAEIQVEPDECKAHWIKAADEFRKVCDALHEENSLPEVYIDLYEQGGSPPKNRSLLEDMPVDLIDAEEFEACVSFCRYVFEMFSLTDEEMSAIGIHTIEALIRAKQYDRAHAFMDEWMEDPGDGYAANAMLMKLLITEEKFDEADRLWEKLKEEHPVCEGSACMLYVIAADLAEAEGDYEYADTLREQAADAYQDIFTEPEDFNPIEEIEEEGTEHYRLFEAVNEFQEDISEATMFEAVKEFSFLVLSDAPVNIEGECCDDGSVNVSISETDDGLRFFTVYSCEEAMDLADCESVFVGEAGSLVSQLADAQVDGICIDPYETKIRMFIERDLLEGLLEAFDERTATKLS
ncbi:MAG: SseB family protein [Solobacterium sp.]|nr:SseB family protein [Solobacterium sp.]